ncbi:hypothetical protein D9M70_543680 [compost metagenome]
MRHQHGKPQHVARPLAAGKLLRVQQFVDRDEVALGLRHLAAFDLQEAVVHPDIRHHLRAVGATGLGDLVFMMREDEVEPAAMNVEDLSEITAAHRRALNMPARTAPAPRTVPARLVVGRKLPQHEIAGIFLVHFHGNAGAGLLFVEVAL